MNEKINKEENEITKIAYFCKNCKKIVNIKKIKKNKFICAKCKKKKIAFGTAKSIKNHYNIKDEKTSIIKK